MVATSYQRILGIDYGSKRIGLALSDPLCIIAQPFDTLANDESFMNRLREIVSHQQVHLVVVGMPFNLKGERAQKSMEVEEFIKRVRLAIDIEVVEWDERFTSTIARQSLREMGAKKKDRAKKDTIDAMAAAVMLQGYLDSKKKSMSY